MTVMQQSLVQDQRRRRHNRVRTKIQGTAVRPRLSAKITNRHIIVQLIDDERGQTLGAVTTLGRPKANLTDQAVWAGTEIGAIAKRQKVSRVVFDRGSRIYHGRLHALAEATRKQGLEF